jgi:hypothetical protein
LLSGIRPTMISELNYGNNLSQLSHRSDQIVSFLTLMLRLALILLY